MNDDASSIQRWCRRANGAGRIPCQRRGRCVQHRIGKLLDATIRHKVPLVITSLGAVRDVVDAVHTPSVSGVNANFLRPSLVQAGLDPDNLKPRGALDMHEEARVWKDIWSAGQGVGAIHDIPSVAALCDRLKSEYDDAIRAVSGLAIKSADKSARRTAALG